MAIANFTAQADNSTDAAFRLWGKGLSDALTAVGVIKTGDTGQINWTTVTHPTVAGAYQGYEIRVLSTPSGFPVYIKIEFGCTSGSVNAPAIRVTVGSGSDGAGTINGSVASAVSISCLQSAVTYNCYVSGDTSRMSFGMFLTDTSNVGMTCAVGRRKDSAGNDLDYGVNITAAWLTGRSQQYLPKPSLGSAYPSAAMTSLQSLCPPSGTGSYNGDTGAFPVFFNLGAPENPDMGLCIYCVGDYATGAVVPVTMYGQTYNFITMGAGISPTANGNGNARVAVRYQ